jgi:hypothetical protein
MDYKNLPVEERITLASQYALLLVGDNKPVSEIIGLLKRDYSLTQEQATEAFAKMRSEYKQEYVASTNKNLKDLISAIILIGFIVLIYYILGTEMGSWSAFPLVLAIFFGLAGLAAFTVLLRTFWEKYTSTTRQIQNPSGLYSVITGKDGKLHYTGQFTCIIFVLFVITAVLYFGKSELVNQKEIATVQKLIISEPLQTGYTGNRHKSYYYTFKFKGHSNEFRFNKAYYKYAMYPLDFNPGDTVSVQINYDDLNSVENHLDSEPVELLNVARGEGDFFVDHTYRNAQLNRRNKNNLNYSMAILGAMLLITIARAFYIAKTNRLSKPA